MRRYAFWAVIAVIILGASGYFTFVGKGAGFFGFGLGAPEHYVCAEGKTLTVAYGEGIARIKLANGRVFTLEMGSFDPGNGTHFSNDSGQIEFFTKDFSAFLKEDGVETYSACVLSPLEFPDAGGEAVYEDAAQMYRVAVPSGWYAHPLSETQVVFTPSPAFELPQATESYAIGDQMAIHQGTFDAILGAKTAEDYLRGIGLTPESEFFVERSDMARAGNLAMVRGVLNAAAADGQTLLYVYFPDGREVITFSHYPYVAGSESARAFEILVDSFVPLEQ